MFGLLLWYLAAANPWQMLYTVFLVFMSYALKNVTIFSA